MDGLPDDHAAVGDVEATIRGGVLTLTTLKGARVLANEAVAPVALDSTRLIYAKREGFECDLYAVALPDGEPERLIDWVGSEDRPSLHGDEVRFYSARTGIVALYSLNLTTREITQLTNVGLEHVERRHGRAPEGFVAPVSP